MERTINATKAVREFSEILNTIKFRRDRYVIERNGKAIACLGPLEKGKSSRPLKDLPFVLKELPKLNDEAEAFASDLKYTVKKQPPLPKRVRWE